MDARVTAARSGTPIRLPGLRLLADERLARMVSGDRGEDAFAVIYERYHQPLYRYCRSMLRNDADAQDALQSAFTGAFTALRRGRREAPVRPWLFRIVHNEAVSVMRRRCPDAEQAEHAERATSTLEERAEERAEERERLRLLMSDLAELPERQRQALVLKELNGLSHEEIAAVLGASVGAAKQALFEARRSLAELAEGRAMTCDDVCREISDDPRYAVRRRRVRAHLQGCGACAAFAAAIETRRADLQALAPALPALAATGLLARLLGGGSSHGGTGAGGLASAATGKALGLAVSAKTTAAIAVLVVATAGLATALQTSSPASHPSLSTMPSSPSVPSAPGHRSGGALRARLHPAQPRLETQSASHRGPVTHTALAPAITVGARAGHASESPARRTSVVAAGAPPAARPKTPRNGTHAVSRSRVWSSAPSRPPAPTTPSTPTPATSTPMPAAPGGTTSTTQPTQTASASPATLTSATTTTTVVGGASPATSSSAGAG